MAICVHSHPIGNRLKTIDFVGDFELHSSKKRLIPSHSIKKRQKRPISQGFCEIPMG
jgi:tyrosyl-tRNA synthetase